MINYVVMCCYQRKEGSTATHLIGVYTDVTVAFDIVKSHEEDNNHTASFVVDVMPTTVDRPFKAKEHYLY